MKTTRNLNSKYVMRDDNSSSDCLCYDPTRRQPYSTPPYKGDCMSAISGYDGPHCGSGPPPLPTQPSGNQTAIAVCNAYAKCATPGGCLWYNGNTPTITALNYGRLISASQPKTEQDSWSCKFSGKDVNGNPGGRGCNPNNKEGPGSCAVEIKQKDYNPYFTGGNYAACGIAVGDMAGAGNSWPQAPKQCIEYGICKSGKVYPCYNALVANGIIAAPAPAPAPAPGPGPGPGPGPAPAPAPGPGPGPGPGPAPPGEFGSNCANDNDCFSRNCVKSKCARKKSHHSKPSHSKPSHSKPSHSKPSHSKPSHSKPSHSKPNHTPSPGPSTDSQGLSTPAVVGISVGGIVLVLGIAVGIIYLAKKKKKGRK